MSDAIEAALDRIGRAGPVLRAASDERVIAWLDATLGALGDAGSPVGREARTTIAARTGLSTVGAAWGLETTIAELRASALERGVAAMRRAHDGFRATPVRTHGLVLAQSVFTACLRPIVWSLLARVPVVVKLATDDEGLAELFAVAASVVDAELGESLAVLWPQGRSEAIVERLAGRVDLLSAHGGDHAIARMRAITPATTELVGHGHGLGVVVILREALSSHLPALAAAVARDVAAYDQRGCLSPQAIFVERGGEIGPRDVAALIASEGLGTLATSMPRGPLPIAIGAQQVQWRGLASSLYELFEGDGYAVSFEGSAKVRPTPGYRNVAVHAIDDAAEVGATLAPYGAHLKVVAIAADPGRVALPPPLAPRVCALGEMQRPPLLAATDGLPPWHGLVRVG